VNVIVTDVKLLYVHKDRNHFWNRYDEQQNRWRITYSGVGGKETTLNKTTN